MPIIRRGPKVTRVKPYRDNVIVLPAKPQDKIGSIVLPDEAKRAQIYGRIIAMGPDVPTNDPVGYAVGDTIVFSQYSGIELDMEDLEGANDVLKVLVMPYKQIVGKIELKHVGSSDKPPIAAPDISGIDDVGATA